MHADQYLIAIYVLYAAIAIGLIVWVARTLEANGAAFLRDVFDDDPDLANAVNRLLVVGFYLFNLGYALLILRAGATPTVLAAVEVLITKLGLLLASLGVIHLVNMRVFWIVGGGRRGARNAARDVRPPAPGDYVADGA